MAKDKTYMMPNLITPNKPVVFNEDICIGCNRCVEVCIMDVLYPNPVKGETPIILYPDECWFCGACIMECPRGEEGAVRVVWPLMSQLRWKRKETGVPYRVGMPDPPPPNTTPPSGGWHPKA
jgi:NAD-dependent dihydropyrimidine dehydrogenase PreA subunit